MGEYLYLCDEWGRQVFGFVHHIYMSRQTDKIRELIDRREQMLLGGGEDAVEKQHSRHKLTARERIERLLDPGTFEELGTYVRHHNANFGADKKVYDGDSVVTGSGLVDGRLVYVYAQDFTAFAGTCGYMHARKICEVQQLAMKVGAPIIGINDSGGARIQEGVNSLAGYGELFENNILASGVVPQISGIFGPCAGGAVYSPALTDFNIMVSGTSYMFLTGPKVVKTVTNEEVTAEELGGASVHTRKSGVAHFAVESDEEGLELMRHLLSFLPSNNMEEAPRIASSDPVDRDLSVLNELIPDNPNTAYDMYEVIGQVVDGGEFLEVQRDFARSIIIGFARIDGRSVGIVANQPAAAAGVLDVNSSRKGARFVRFCDAFNIPIVSLVDVPGFLPGTGQEYNAVITNGAKLLYAYGEATVPKITVITRKAYGGAYIVMGSKHLRADINLAWPSAEIAVMGPDGAVEILYGKALRDAEDPAALKEEHIREYREKFANPYYAASYGFIDDVIVPDETRKRIARALRDLRNKRQELPSKKHDNIPL